jgi:hypothetical protein
MFIVVDMAAVNNGTGTEDIRDTIVYGETVEPEGGEIDHFKDHASGKALERKGIVYTSHALLDGANVSLDLGEYAQVHEDTDNSMVARTAGAISLRSIGNEQGGYYFFSLATGRVINRIHGTTRRQCVCFEE